MMTIKEVKELYTGQYVDVEVYCPCSVGRYYPRVFHTDNCYCAPAYTDDSQVGFYELMDEDTYDNTLLANGSLRADFDEWYGNKNVKLLCIMLAEQL